MRKRKRRMTGYRRYMIKQKLIGLAIVALSMILIVISLFTDMKIWFCAMITSLPIGLMILFSDKMVIEDSYYREMKRKNNYKWRFE